MRDARDRHGDGVPDDTVHRDHRQRSGASAGESGSGNHGGHGGHGDHAAVFRRLFWINLALAVPVFLYSDMLQEWLGFTPPSFPGDDLVAPALGTAIFLVGGRPFLAGGL